MAREGFFYEPEPVGKQAHAQRRNKRFVEDDGRSVASKLKGSKDHKPLDYKGQTGAKMQEGGADRKNMERKVREQQLVNDSYGHKTGGGSDGPETPPMHEKASPKPPPDPARGPTAKGTPEEIARGDKQREKETEDRANGITPPDELDSRKIDTPDWKGAPPLKTPPPSAPQPPKKIPPDPGRPQSPKGPPPIIRVPDKKKPTVIRRSGLSTYGSQVR